MIALKSVIVVLKFICLGIKKPRRSGQGQSAKVAGLTVESCTLEGVALAFGASYTLEGEPGSLKLGRSCGSKVDLDVLEVFHSCLF